MPDATPRYKVVKVHTASFHLPLSPAYLKAFRSAIVNWAYAHETLLHGAGVHPSVFDNSRHIGDVRYDGFSYPGMFYQVINRVASLTAIGEGIPALELFLRYHPPYVWLENQRMPLELAAENRQRIRVGITPKWHHYRLASWVPLNSENYQSYRQTDTLHEKTLLLEQCLYGHLKSFAIATGLQYRLEDLRCHLRMIHRRKTVRVMLKNQWYRKIGLDVDIITNLRLPENIGLGMHCSHGFGRVIPIDRLTQKNPA